MVVQRALSLPVALLLVHLLLGATAVLGAQATEEPLVEPHAADKGLGTEKIPAASTPPTAPASKAKGHMYNAVNPVTEIDTMPGVTKTDKIKQLVKFYTGDEYSGESFTTWLSTEYCTDLAKVALSVDTWGSCIRVYSRSACGSPGVTLKRHEDIAVRLKAYKIGKAVSAHLCPSDGPQKFYFYSWTQYTGAIYPVTISGDGTCYNFAIGPNDNTMSLYIPYPYYCIVVYADYDCQGRARRFTGGSRGLDDLSKVKMADVISSFQHCKGVDNGKIDYMKRISPTVKQENDLKEASISVSSDGKDFPIHLNEQGHASLAASLESSQLVGNGGGSLATPLPASEQGWGLTDGHMVPEGPAAQAPARLRRARVRRSREL